MKFGDVILAVATTVVIEVLLYFPFGIALIPSVGSYWGQTATSFVSLLIAGLVVGLAFAEKIQEESRIRSVGKIAVLLAAVMLFVVLIAFSGNSYYAAYIKEGLQSMFSTGAWTTVDWFVYEEFAMLMNVALNVSMSLVLGFIGLYAGSMLRKPRKS